MQTSFLGWSSDFQMMTPWVHIYNCFLFIILSLRDREMRYVYLQCFPVSFLKSSSRLVGGPESKSIASNRK